MRALLLMPLLLVACSATSEPTRPTTQAEAPEARAIIARMTERYRIATTYRDEGTGVAVMSRGTYNVTRSQFRTRWMAPNRMTFELRDEATGISKSTRLAVWTDRSSKITKSLFNNRIREDASLADGLGSMIGLSHLVTGLAAGFLVEGGCRPTATYQLVGTVSCGAANTCFELAGTLPGRDVKLFIDTTTSALRKYVSRSVIQYTEEQCQLRVDFAPKEIDGEALRKYCLEPFTVDQTIEFNPVFDAPISEHEFDVDTSGAQTETPD
jgi:hypothetical protein